MQSIHDFLLSIDEINRELLVNGVLLLFDLVILALLLPSFIGWLEDRKWRAMRLSLLTATIDLLESAFYSQPPGPPGTYIDHQTHAAVDDAIFRKLQLFASALTPDQSASVAAMVELSIDVATKVNRLRVNVELTRNVIEKSGEALREAPIEPKVRKRKFDRSASDYAKRMLDDAIVLASVEIRPVGEAIIAHIGDPASKAQAVITLEVIIDRVEGEIGAAVAMFDMLIWWNPPAASSALSRSKAHLELPEHFADHRIQIDGIFEEWEREDALQGPSADQ